jgi:hypothetical protein
MAEFDKFDEDEDFRSAQAAAGRNRGSQDGKPEPESKAEPRPERKPRDRRFIKVPIWWLTKAKDAVGTSGELFVACWLLYLAFENKSPTFSVPTGKLQSYGVSRSTKSRALAKLEAAGLILVDRLMRKNPIVTLLL